MSKPKFTHNEADRRYEFFRAHGFDRRRVKLDRPPTLQANAKGDERRIVFNVLMPLTGQSMVGFPAFLQSAYESVEKEGSLVSKSSLDGFVLEGLDLEFFSTDSGGKFFTRLVNKNIYDFRVESLVDDDMNVTVLRFKFRAKENFGTFSLWHKHGMQDIFMEAIPNSSAVANTDENQMVLGEEPDDTDGEDGDSLPDQDAERREAVSAEND